MERAGRTLGARFGAQPNALNFLRLCLALEVVIWHSYALRGRTWLPDALERLMADVAVDSFFAISGFLIVRAWVRNPDALKYLAARAGRILPGLWVCLLVTAFLVAPSVTDTTGADRWDYVLGNADTWGTVYSISGGPVGLPHPGAWNGSLWSLGYETGAYLGVLILAFVGLLRGRGAAALALVFWSMSLSFAVSGVPMVGSIGFTSRCGLMFAMGVLAWFYRDHVVLSAPLALAAVAMVGVGALTLPDYRLIGAPAVAYLCLAGGVWLGNFPRLVLRHDLSYGIYIYAFPLQQALLLLLGASLGWAPFAALTVALVVPVAAVSWFVVERPAIIVTRRFGRRFTAEAIPAPAA